MKLYELENAISSDFTVNVVDSDGHITDSINSEDVEGRVKYRNCEVRNLYPVNEVLVVINVIKEA